ncbi:hypothetical protein [Pelagicoccus mobilis]|uniref:Uncharacterized protein n=1 Tax=Pelagicoccus mobilis TaxID=415221 RepID=A0A934RUG3_9BACT|nr:hypothetical protein [Pelagicoccus mobilis]MBK1877067.1 hypothetical protein [Pelagicoccus mobilis]
MKSDNKLALILFLIAAALTFLSHVVGDSSTVLIVTLTVPAVAAMILPPSVLAFRKRRGWILISLIYIAFAFPVFVVIGVYASNIGELEPSEFLNDLHEIIPQAYLALGSLSAVFAVLTTLSLAVYEKWLKRP